MRSSLHSTDEYFSAIPNLDCQRTIFSSRDVTLKSAKRKGMIFDPHCQPAHTGFAWNSFRNCPALEHAVLLKPQVEMVGARMMLLNDGP